MAANNIRSRRLANEVRELDNCWPVEEDRLDVLDAKVIGPEGTPYENGVFMLRIEIPDRYPFDPPRVRFITKIYHPNIDKQNGTICLEILKTTRETCWKATFNIHTVLCAIKQLIGEPNPDDPVEREIAAQMLLDNDKFEATAREWSQRYAVEDATGGSLDASGAEKGIEEVLPVFSPPLEDAIPDDPFSDGKELGLKRKQLFSSKARNNDLLSQKQGNENQVGQRPPTRCSQSSQQNASVPAEETLRLSQPREHSDLSGSKDAPPPAKSPRSQAEHSPTVSPAANPKKTTVAKPASGKKSKAKEGTAGKKGQTTATPNQQKKARYEDLFLDDDDRGDSLF